MAFVGWTMNLYVQTGPCSLCGDTDYPLSMGGPSICPRCDCSPPSPLEIRRLHETIASLQAQLLSPTPDHGRALAAQIADEHLAEVLELVTKLRHGFDRDEDGFAFIVEHNPNARCGRYTDGNYQCHCGLVATVDALRGAEKLLEQAIAQVQRLGEA